MGLFKQQMKVRSNGERARIDHCPTAACNARKVSLMPEGASATVPCVCYNGDKVAEKMVPLQPECVVISLFELG